MEFEIRIGYGIRKTREMSDQNPLLLLSASTKKSAGQKREISALVLTELVRILSEQRL